MKNNPECNIKAFSRNAAICIGFFLITILTVFYFGFTQWTLSLAYSSVTVEPDLRICRANKGCAPDKDRNKWIDCLKKAYHKTKPNPDAVEMAEAIYKIWNKSVTKSALEKALKSIKTEDGAMPVFSDIQIKKGMDAIKRDKPVIRFFISLKKGQPCTTFTQEEPIGLVWDGDHIREYKLFYMEKTGLEVGDKTTHEIPEREFKTDTTLILKASNKFGDETYKALTINIVNPELKGYVQKGARRNNDHLYFTTCDGKLCSPIECLKRCQSLGGRMATYAEVYAWASGGKEKIMNMWMLDTEKRNTLLKGHPKYKSPAKRWIKAKSYPYIESLTEESWDSASKQGCACSNVEKYE